MKEIDYLEKETEGGESEGKMREHLIHSPFLFYPLWSENSFSVIHAAEMAADCKVMVSDGSADKLI